MITTVCHAVRCLERRSEIVRRKGGPCLFPLRPINGRMKGDAVPVLTLGGTMTRKKQQQRPGFSEIEPKDGPRCDLNTFVNDDNRKIVCCTYLSYRAVNKMNEDASHTSTTLIIRRFPQLLSGEGSNCQPKSRNAMRASPLCWY